MPLSLVVESVWVMQFNGITISKSARQPAEQRTAVAADDFTTLPVREGSGPRDEKQIRVRTAMTNPGAARSVSFLFAE
jgi:hypothetical protein